MSFSDTFDFLTNNTLSRAELSSEGKIKNIHYGDILVKFGDILDCSFTQIPYISKNAKIGNKVTFLKDGDVIIADTAEDETVGKATEIINVSMPIVSGLHTMACRPKFCFEPRYLGYYINSSCYHNQLFPFMQGVKVTSVGKGNIANTHIRYPSKQEQQKISSMLAIIDNRIEKQQALVESLKLYKRGVLSQIFNQSLSFKGSATRWQKKTIGDIFAERCERANGDEELLAVTINTGIQKRDDIDKKDNSSENKSNYKKVYPGDIAYNTMRMWQGASGYSSLDEIVSPAYTVIYPIEPDKQNIVFWAYYFKDLELIKKFQKYSQGLTSDTWNLKFAQLADIHIYEPPYETQCNVANFLTKLDNKITITEYYCNKLYLIKHGLLNGMFI